MVEWAARFRERWAEPRPVRAGAVEARLGTAGTPESPVSMDIHREMMRLTLAIVGETLFSAEVESQAREIRDALSQAFGMFEMVLLPFSELLEKLPLPAVRRFHKARARLDKVIYGMISDRRASGEDKGDLLSMLLLARDEEGHGGMTDQQVRDEALT